MARVGSGSYPDGAHRTHIPLRCYPCDSYSLYPLCKPFQFIHQLLLFSRQYFSNLSVSCVWSGVKCPGKSRKASKLLQEPKWNGQSGIQCPNFFLTSQCRYFKDEHHGGHCWSLLYPPFHVLGVLTLLFCFLNSASVLSSPRVGHGANLKLNASGYSSNVFICCCCVHHFISGLLQVVHYIFKPNSNALSFPTCNLEFLEWEAEL